YFTLTNGGTVFGTYDATFSWIAGDVDAGATPDSFEVRSFDGANWGAAGTASRTPTSIQSTGQTIFGDFAVGELTNWTITSSSGANGTISPLGAISVKHGNDLTFTMIPDLHYTVQDVLIDGVSFGAMTSYVFTNVSANHTIAVSYTLQ